MAQGARALGRRVPRDDLLPRLPDRRVPAGDRFDRDRVARRRDARRLARVRRRDAEAARGRRARRARRAEGGDPHARGRRAREARRAQAPDHRALPHGLHGLHGCRVARARGRARRHVHRRDDRADQRAPRRSGPLPARVAGRHRSSSRPRTRSSSRSRSSRSDASGRIVRLAEHDGDLLHWFYDEGLVPGSHVCGRLGPARRRAAHDRASTDAERAITRARGGRDLRPRGVSSALRIAHALLRADHMAVPGCAGHSGEIERRLGRMRLNRHAVGAFAASATLLVGGGAALAASGDGDRERTLRGAPRQDRREARRLGRAAAGRHQGTPARSHRRGGEGRPDLVGACDAAARARRGGKPLRRAQARQGADRRARAMLRAAADFLGLDRAAASRSAAGHLARGARGEAGQERRRRWRPRWWRRRRRGSRRRSRAGSSRRRARTRSLERLEKLADRLATHVFAEK